MTLGDVADLHSGCVGIGDYSDVAEYMCVVQICDL